MTIIIIGVCGVMFVISLIVAVIVISNRVLSSSPPAPDLEGKPSPGASHHHLLYDQVKPGGQPGLSPLTGTFSDRNDGRG